jgi:hypothetical protein
MTQAIEQVYFTWLCDRVNYCYGRNRNKTFLDLMGQLHSKEFVWVVPNDDNRLEDAENLRYQFVHEVGINNPENIERRVVDFYQIRVKESKEGLELYPDFTIGRSQDLMVQGRTFYAIWDEEHEVSGLEMSTMYSV